MRQSLAVLAQDRGFLGLHSTSVFPDGELADGDPDDGGPAQVRRKPSSSDSAQATAFSGVSPFCIIRPTILVTVAWL